MTNVLPTLPPRDPAGHKGTFGTVCVIGGQSAGTRVMIGGPALTALGALRSGAGLAVLAVPAPIMNASLVMAPSATGLALPVDADGALAPSRVAEVIDDHRADFGCIAVGPGWGAEVPQQQVLVRLLASDGGPLLVDADAINAMAAIPQVQRDLRAPCVLTPHPGEYRRLARSIGLDADPTDPETRPDAAAQLATRLGCVVVLKGAGTVVSDGLNTVVNRTGNAALATAGTGDVLSGVIAGLVAQFFRPAGAGDGLGLFECARIGVWVHGMAADLWAARHGAAGLLAGDLVDLIPTALAELDRSERD